MGFLVIRGLRVGGLRPIELKAEATPDNQAKNGQEVVYSFALYRSSLADWDGTSNVRYRPDRSENFLARVVLLESHALAI